MISDVAVNDIRDMQKEGLNPTPEDIVRLNAIGLKIERNRKCGDVYAVPRVSYLGSSETFREPTLAHLTWIDRVLAYVNKSHYGTYLAVNAFALSRDHAELPDANSRKKCIRAIDEYVDKNLSKFTFSQIRAAVLYALQGSDHVSLEYPPTDDKQDDVLRSVGVGVLMETVAMGLGCSLREISGMTVSQAKLLQTFALYAKGVDPVKRMENTLIGEYHATVWEIRERLKAEKEKANGGK